jgi:hypothetical protein
MPKPADTVIVACSFSDEVQRLIKMKGVSSIRANQVLFPTFFKAEFWALFLRSGRWAFGWAGSGPLLVLVAGRGLGGIYELRFLIFELRFFYRGSLFFSITLQKKMILNPLFIRGSF